MGGNMNLLTPPEIADGGYWYVVEATPDPELGGMTPGVIPGVGWGAWYANGFVAVRCPSPVDGMRLTDLASVKNVLSAEGATAKPYARVGGF
jgi:hypothetical protein